MRQNINKMLLFCIVVIVIFMSVGYSVLNRELSITGDLIYRAEADIRITNVRLDNVGNTVESFSPNFSKDEVIIGFNMGSDTSTITYKIEVTNYSDVEMGILKIEGLPSTYEIKDYTLKTKLVDTLGNSKSGMIKEFSIVLKADASFKGIQNVRLKLDFEPIYTITYSGFNDDSSYLKEIIKTENYSQTLDNSVDDILVTMNNISTSNYTFNNKKLEIQNVDGNILIENNTPNAPVLNGDMIPVYYEATSDTEGVWKKADINNEDNNWYDYKTQKWANAVTVVEESVKDLSGNNQNGAVYGAKVENGEAYFDGVDDFVEAGYANYDFKDSVSINVRLKVHKFTSNNQNQSIIGNQEQAGTCLYITSSKIIGFDVHNGTSYETFMSNYTIELEKWYEVTATFYQNKMTIYIKDDSELHTFTKELVNNINIQVSIMPFVLGVNLDPTSMQQASNISISEASVYNRAISAEEIETNNIKNNNLLFKYNFNQLINRDYYTSAAKDEIIPMNNINTMWVWIPRYSYTIKKETGSSDYYGKQEAGRNTIPTKALPGEIDVKFINNSINEQGKAQYTGNMITNWYTNEAFNFDEVKRNGVWISKFEITGRLEKNDDACIDENCNVSKVTIKPTVRAVVNQKLSSLFYITRSIQKDTATFGFSTSGNIHMIRNDEWGAVAYLSQSRYGKYGNRNYSGANKEVYQNKTSLQTGSSNGTPGQSATTTPQYKYNDMTNLGVGKGQAGPGASTTGTIYGIYDMSGGMHEYTMGAITYSSSDEFPMSGYSKDVNTGFTGKLSDGTDFEGIDFFSKSNSIYYDLYKTTNSENACNNGVCYGHALSETKGWYNDSSNFMNVEYPWAIRGGHVASSTTAGMFYFNRLTTERGGKSSGASTRVAIIP